MVTECTPIQLDRRETTAGEVLSKIVGLTRHTARIQGVESAALAVELSVTVPAPPRVEAGA